MVGGLVPGVVFGGAMGWEGAVFQIVGLAALGFWCWMIYWFRGQVWACLKSAVTLKTYEGSAGAGAGSKQLYDRFLGVALGLGAMVVGIAVVKIFGAGLADPGAGFEAPGKNFGAWMPLVVMPGVAVAAVCVVAAQIRALKAAGSLTFTGETTDGVIRAKKTYLAAGTVLVAPLILMYTGVNPLRDAILGYVAIGEGVAVAVMFVVHTLLLFIKQKVSLLVWFLYLCTLEIFPVSLVVLLATRNI